MREGSIRVEAEGDQLLFKITIADRAGALQINPLVGTLANVEEATLRAPNLLDEVYLNLCLLWKGCGESEVVETSIARPSVSVQFQF